MKRTIPLLILLIGCVSTSPSILVEETTKSTPVLEIHSSLANDTLIFHIQPGAEFDEDILIKTLNEYSQQFDYETLLQLKEDDSTAILTASYFSSDTRLPYRPEALSTNDKGVVLSFVIDKNRITSLAETFMANGSSISPTPIAAANPHMIENDSFSYLPDNLLLEPCPGISYPKSSKLIPNAPRTYRSGTHRGIDFPAPYGSRIRAVEDGVVIRADHYYMEVTNEFRKSLLKKASQIGRTPSDVFEHILFGRAVFIDHGINLIDGKRLISIYAHMSEIAGGINVGVSVKRGQTLGKVGNSGTSDGALKNRKGAHLHFELIIQDKTGERYMGQGLNHDSLTNLLDRLFISK